MEIPKTDFIYVVNVALIKAPKHMKPACPKLNSPEIPTTKFKETAIIEYTQNWTSNPFINELIFLSNIVTKQYNIIIPTKVILLSINFFLYILHLL